MFVRTLFYVKPVMNLDQKRRYLRLNPEEASDEAKKPMYKHETDKEKSIVKIDFNFPGAVTYVVVFIEHPSIQKKTATDICDDWIEWFNDMCWQLGLEDEQIDEIRRVNHH